MGRPNKQVPPAPMPDVPSKDQAQTRLRAVYGRMVHPFTQDEFNVGTVTTVETIDSWTQVQVDAGKLAHVAD